MKQHNVPKKDKLSKKFLFYFKKNEVWFFFSKKRKKVESMSFFGTLCCFMKKFVLFYAIRDSKNFEKNKKFIKHRLLGKFNN